MDTTAVELAVPDCPALGATLVFGAHDLLEVLPAGRVPADIVLRTRSSVLAAGRGGGSGGSGLVMSGAVTAPAEWEPLAALRDRLTGPRFVEYARGIAAPWGGPPTDRRAGWALPSGDGGPGGSTAVVSLGSANDDAGRIDRVGSDRLHAAVLAAEATPGALLVLTGGFGSHFNQTGVPHWEHCVRWIRREFPGFARPLAYVESAHTYEDMLILRELVRETTSVKVILVTSDFHAERVRVISDLVLPGCRTVGVRHRHLSRAEHRARTDRETRTLGMTVAAALLFGPDRVSVSIGSYGPVPQSDGHTPLPSRSTLDAP